MEWRIRRGDFNSLLLRPIHPIFAVTSEMLASKAAAMFMVIPAMFALAFYFSGPVAPLTVLPEWAQQFSNLLPFKRMFYFPLELLVVVGVHTLLGGVIKSVIQPNMYQVAEGVQEGHLDYILTKPEDSQLLVSISRFELRRLVDMFVGLGVLPGAGGLCGNGAGRGAHRPPDAALSGAGAGDGRLGPGRRPLVLALRPAPLLRRVGVVGIGAMAIEGAPD